MSIIRRIQNLAVLLTGLLLSAQSMAQGAPAELRVGYQKGTINLTVLKERGLLEQRFKGAAASAATRVTWVEFAAGPQLLEALAVGSIDFGATGDSPPVFAQAAGKNLVYVGYEVPKPDTSAVLVPADSPIKSLEDLKGKKIAMQKGSSAHFLTVQALKRAKLAWSDIQPIYLAPADARAAFERGSVDAWSIWDPYYAAVEESGKVRVLATSRGLSNNNTFYLASSAFAARHGSTLIDVFEELTQAEKYVQNNRVEAVQLLTKAFGLEQKVIERVLARRPLGAVKPINADVLLDQQQVADAFFQLGLIPAAVKVADIVWKPTANDLARR
ncbi:sulfonate ABC transporter substrate-binding protein [Uliginosibacterium sp. H3]|uniref:Sulfonate ABC transporter substrate-binding protein n=1 Tax=Uliginosibacterium silvisoli TaxID=3114758 RepID=A0ABU6JZU6_9RHOO|nr:sulfonate ABC transporter substrate-binding protein [Uliginosibacterium sp. H3]